MKFIELFAGIGGFRYGLERAGDFKCVWANDIDKYACRIYRKNFGDKELYEGDIRTVEAATIPDHDLIVGGFPCQSFSIAGKRGGFEDTRGTLFFEICRIARTKRTKYLFLENVKGLLNHNKGKTFETIIRTLDELGYDCEWQVLNSKNYGVPQNRERVFIIANLRGERRFQVFPIREDSQSDIVLSTLTARYYGGQANGGYIGYKQEQKLDFLYGIMGDKNKMWLEDGKDNSRNFPQGQRVYSPDGISAQLTAQGGGWGAKTGLYEIPETAQALQTDGICPTIPTGMGGGVMTKIAVDVAPTLHGFEHGTNGQLQKQLNKMGMIRRLTPIECERLQGFPEIEKSAIIEIWKNNYSDQPKTLAPNAANQCPKLLKYVGNVENTDYQEYAKSVEQNISIRHQQTKEPVQPDVLIYCGENIVKIHSQGKLLLSVRTVEKGSQYPLVVPADSFVQMIAGINTIVARIISYGKVELHQKERCLIHQRNGEKLVSLSGKGIMQLVNCAKNDLIIPKEPMKSITLNHLDINILEQELITLFWYVINAIDGYIPNEILNKSFLQIKFVSKSGWTKYGIMNGKQVEISDSQRYKCCGNAVTTNVITEIGKRIIK